MEVQGRQLIDGNWQQAAAAGGGNGGKHTFAAINPATGQPLDPPFAEATPGQVNAALAAASDAFSALRDCDARWPADLLEGIAREILALGDPLLDRAQAETALPRPRLLAERARTVAQLNLFASVVRAGEWLDATIDTAEPARQPQPRPDIRRIMVPRGPVVVFGASNFPFAFSTAGGDTASALAAGNPVIVKGHPSHPGTSELSAIAVLRALEALDLPRGLFALLQGASLDLGAQLVRHPATAAVAFTGSQRGGRALFDMAAARPRPIPVYAEMGSLNPLIIMPGALRDRGPTLAKELAASILLGGGQFCTKPGLILLPADSAPFVSMLRDALAAATPITMLNQGLRDHFTKRLAEWAKIPGVTAHLESRPTGHAAVSAALFETTPALFLKEAALREEAFGPAALLVRCDGTPDIVATLEALGGSLTGTLHAGPVNDTASKNETAPGDDLQPLLHALEPVVGRIILNGFPTGVEVCSAMVHGGPYPATTDPGTTSVGTAAMRRFLRIVAYQNLPDALLPPPLQNANPLAIPRLVNGVRTSEPVAPAGL